MKKSECILMGLINAAAVAAYVAGVAWVMFNGKNVFPAEDNFLMPMFLLLMFIVSASITGFLVLGKPLQLLIAGLKQEAIILFCATLAWLVLFALSIVVVLRLV